MNKVLISGDLHLGITTDNFLIKNGYSRLLEQEKILNDQIKYAINNNIKNAVYAGDIFHNSNPSSAYRDIFYKILNMIKSYKINVYIESGNHDFSINGTNALQPLKSVGFDIIDDVSIREICGKKFLFVPHMSVESFDCFNDNFSIYDGNDYGIGHFHAIGAVSGSEDNMLSGNCVAIKNLPVCNRWILGHIHKSQDFMLGNNKISYVGSIVKVDFGEINDKKSFIVLDVDSGDIERVAVNCVEYKNISFDECDFNVSLFDDVYGKVVKVNINKYTGKISVDDIEKLCKGCVAIRSVIFNKDTSDVDDGFDIKNISLKDAVYKYFCGDVDAANLAMDILKRCEK